MTHMPVIIKEEEVLTPTSMFDSDDEFATRNTTENQASTMPTMIKKSLIHPLSIIPLPK